jgi:PKD repeat protein
VHVGQNGYAAFTQPNVTVNSGDTIHWIWDGSGHSVTSGTGPPSDNKFPDSGVKSSGFTYDQTFATPGVYHYYCKIHYAYGMVGTITVLGPDTPPTASFTTSPPNLTAGQAVTFTASASDSDGDTIATYKWDFGDGQTQTTSTASTTHAYRAAGSYTAKLIAVDSRGSTSSPVMQTVTVGQGSADSPPTARFTSTPANPTVGQAVTFNGSASSDADGDAITSYLWDFGDGTTQTTAAATVTHTYALARPVTAKLVVVDGRGTPSAAAFQAITIGQAPGAGPPGPGPAPRVTKLHLSKGRFCVKRSRTCRHPGARISFALSKAVGLKLVVTHRGKAIKHTKLAGKRGTNTFTFSGAGLRPGRYTLTLTPAGGTSRRARFTVVAS